MTKKTRYIPPSEVISPKRSWTLIKVLYDEGKSDQGNARASVALGKWGKDPVLAMRWNGDEENNTIGNPQSRGLPTWFIVPKHFRDALVGTLPKQQQMLAKSVFEK
jgi:hypothetical protein